MQIIKYILIIAAVFTVPTICFAEDDETLSVIMTLFDEATEATMAEDYETAIEKLNMAIAVDPLNSSLPIIMSNLGLNYMFQGNDSLALATLDRALAIAPNMVTVLNNRALVYINCGDIDNAYSDLSRAIALDSTYTDARYMHGMIALNSGDYQTAEEDFDVLEARLPYDKSTWLAKGVLYAYTSRERQAIPYLKKLIGEEPSPEYYATLAACHLVLSELSEASEVIAEGMEKYPESAELYYYRARLNRDSYMLRQAHDDARMAKQLGADPAMVDALFAE